MGDAGCEYASDDRTNYLAQKVTSLSNFSFSFVALIALQFALLDARANGLSNIFCNHGTVVQSSQLVGAHPMLSVKMAFVCAAMAASSFIWHASLADRGAKFDFGCMYLLIDYIIGLCALRLLGEKR
ncbi:hypothetical protein TrRE_jg2654 [Triparma retinervis]|uniref:Uncharacterized protein n=1 Tax=Triparma retinervis TaxID=2557542 RepID=A0A9W6ZJ93_9STRA|nr:hypothetical protein TrRE_jg2654 [Triparma retinervis]